MTSSNDHPRLSPIALSDSDRTMNTTTGLDHLSIHRKSSASSDNGLYEPIGEPRSVCTLERVVQLLHDRGPPPGAAAASNCNAAVAAAAAGHDNVYTAIDDDVCSFYSFQSSQSSATNPSGRGSRQPTVGGTLTSNIYDPVSLEINGDQILVNGDQRLINGEQRISRPASTSNHWNTLETKRGNSSTTSSSLSPTRRVPPPINDDQIGAHQAPPPRPVRPGVMAGVKADQPSALDAIVENQTVASPPLRYHAPAASSSSIAQAGSYNHPQSASSSSSPSSSQFPYRSRSSSKPFKEVARAKMMAAIQAPSTKKITNLFSRFPRRSKSLDPNFAMRVNSGVNNGRNHNNVVDDDARDPVTSAANARVRGSDVGLEGFASRMKARKPIVKQKSFDDQFLTSSSSSSASPPPQSSASKSTAKDAKDKKLHLRLMEMLRIDKWHQRHYHNRHSPSKDHSSRNVSLHTSSFFSTSMSASTNNNNSINDDAEDSDNNDSVRRREKVHHPLVRDFGSQGRLVATGSGETLVAHLEREIKSKQIIVPATPMGQTGSGGGVTTTVISSTTTTTTTRTTTTHNAAVLEADDKDSSRLTDKKTVTKPVGKSSTAIPPLTLPLSDAKKANTTISRVVAPKERPKVPPPKTPTFSSSSSHSFELKPIDLVVDASKGSSSSTASSSPPTAPCQPGNAVKPAVPKKPQFALHVQPTPPPRKVNRGPRSTSTGNLTLKK